MTSKEGQDHFILFAASTPKILRVTDVFHQSCVRRLQKQHSEMLIYMPWMSSIGYAKDVEVGKVQLTTDFSENRLDVDPEYLRTLNEWLHAWLIV